MTQRATDAKRTVDKMDRLATALERLPERLRLVMESAARVYAGKPVTRAGKVVSARGSIVGRHFSGTNATRYEALDPEYAKAKAKKFGTKPILVRTGDLKRSIVGRGTIMATSRGFRISWPDSTGYGRYHMNGEGVPRRDFITPNAADLLELRAVVQRMVTEEVVQLKRIMAYG